MRQLRRLLQFLAVHRRWRFSHTSPTGQGERGGVRAAAAFWAASTGELGEDAAPRTDTQLAVAAVETHALFLSDARPAVVAVRVALTRRRE